MLTPFLYRLAATTLLTGALLADLPAGFAMPPSPEPTRAPVASSEIAAGIDRLGVVGSVLYVAAHPDDENTRLLAWLHGDRHLSSAYMSFTRGDGGQNLIGPELGASLGLIRTFELLGARAIDGASQYFSRATDFGYSKSAEETLRVWPRVEVLGDLVEVIRRHAPDLIITRFSIEPPNHGHHTASALLAREAFVLAADPTAYPEQLKELAPHRARVLFENKSHWRFKEGEDLSAYLNVDVGTSDPLTGRTFTEVAARSRSQHKSQGFGSSAVFGVQKEYFEVQAVTPGQATPGSLLGDFDFSWKRFPKTEAVMRAFEALRAGFDVRAPAASVPGLLAYIAAVKALPSDGLIGHYRDLKLAEAGGLVAASLGLLLDATVDSPVVGAGEALEAKITAFARATPPQALGLGIGSLIVNGARVPVDSSLVNLDKPFEKTFEFRAKSEPAVGFGTIAADPRQIPTVTVEVLVGKVTIPFSLPLRQVVTDPVAGEKRTDLTVMPRVTVTPELSEGGVLPAPNAAPVVVPYRVEAHGGARAGTVAFVASSGFDLAPSTISFDLKEGEAQTFEVTVRPRGTATATVQATVSLKGAEPFAAMRLTRIAYDHLPPLVKLAPAAISVASFPLAKGKVRRVGYIAGAADEVAESLTRVGYAVESFDPDASFDPKNDPIRGFDAIVVGIRALNVNPALDLHFDRLMRWVQAGGTLIWQYNVSSRFRPLGPVRMGPTPLEIGGDRVTDEAAKIEAIADDKGRAHRVLETPNRLGPSDYAGWVQERGLYFASSWQAPWQPIFRMADPGEAPLEGSLVVASHGKGHVVYTGLGFFRQLPAGVPGAFRLFANLVAL